MAAKGERDFTFVLTDELRLLVIDDDPIQREFAPVFLAGPRVVIDTAADGAEGMRMLASNKYDLVITDMEMPVMGGLEVIRRIRADPALANLPIIVVTSLEDMASIDRAYEAGATSFVTKPVNWRLLSYQLRFVLRAAGLATNRLPSSGHTG
jgi:CheY-like chemotaxis protein